MSLVGIVASNTLWAAAIAGAAVLVTRWTDRHSVSHLLWLLALAKLVTPPILVVPLPGPIPGTDTVRQAVTALDTLVQRSISPQSDPRTGPIVPSRMLPASSEFASRPPRDDTRRPDASGQRSSSWSSWGSRVSGVVGRIGVWIWGLGSTGVVFWVAVGHWRIGRLLRDRSSFDVRATAIATTELARTGPVGKAPATSAAPPAVWMVDAVISPMLVGSGKRCRILFPSGLWRRIDAESRASVIRHELAHFRRGDPWVRYFECVVLILAWWHPLVWIARRRIADAEEICCDRAAIEAGGIEGEIQRSAIPRSEAETLDPRASVTPRRSDTARRYAESILVAIDFLCDSPGGRLSPGGMRPVASEIGPLRRIEQRLERLLDSARLRSGGSDITDRLEFRLRAIMKPAPERRKPYFQRLLVASGVAATLLVYPAPTLSNPETGPRSSTRSMSPPPESHGVRNDVSCVAAERPPG